MPSKLQHLINTIFALTCIIHVSLIVYNNLFPEFPERKISKHQLNEIEFPLEFLLCANQFKDEAKRYRNVGYLDNGAFFQGKIDGKKSIGWGGQHHNGSSYGSVEGRIQFVIFIYHVCILFSRRVECSQAGLGQKAAKNLCVIKTSKQLIF